LQAAARELAGPTRITNWPKALDVWAICDPTTANGLFLPSRLGLFSAPNQTIGPPSAYDWIPPEADPARRARKTLQRGGSLRMRPMWRYT
jgi:hypothetical protein